MEESKSRTIPEIQQEYQSQCLRAGDIQYRISVMSRDLELVNERMKALNNEAAAVKAAEAKAAAEAPKTEENNNAASA